MCLLVWDKLFGTFQPELPDEPVRYGLHKNVIQRDAVNIVLHEWKAIYKDTQKSDKLADKLNYIFAPPGWSHDGSTQTAAILRQQLAENQAIQSVNIKSQT